MTAVASVLAHREIPAGAPACASTPARSTGHAPAPAAVPTSVPAARRFSLLRRREITAGSLAALAVGDVVQVDGVGGDLEPAAARRLVDLGFAPGARVEVLRRAPMSDPTVYRVADTEIALRRRHAEMISVTTPTPRHR